MRIGSSSYSTRNHDRRGRFVLIDEKLGRATAKQLGLSVTGIVGVLIAAKRRGLHPDAVALARELQQNGIWLSEDLVAEIERA